VLYAVSWMYVRYILRVSVTGFHQDRNSRHTHTHTQPMIMTYDRILYKNITNVHPWNST